MFDKLQGLEKIKQMGLPHPPYIALENKEVTQSRTKEVIKKLGIPNLKGERLGIVIRTSGAGRLGGRSELHLTNAKDIVDWAIKLKNKNDAHVKLIIQHVVDAKCSGVIIKDSKTIVEIINGDAPNLLEGKTTEIERWVIEGNTWKLDDNAKQRFLNANNFECLAKYINIIPDYSYLEWSLSKNGNFYFYEFMDHKEKRKNDDSFEIVGQQIKGYGASSGTASGFVKVIIDPTNINDVKKGEVLVIPYADRHVAHIIKKIAALITERGGVTSHAAIIAREFEVPCVIGLEDATIKLKTGMRVTVNGSNGTVHI